MGIYRIFRLTIFFSVLLLTEACAPTFGRRAGVMQEITVDASIPTYFWIMREAEFMRLFPSRPSYIPVEDFEESVLQSLQRFRSSSNVLNYRTGSHYLIYKCDSYFLTQKIVISRDNGQAKFSLTCERQFT